MSQIIRSILLALAVSLVVAPAAPQEQAPAGAYFIDRTHATIQWSALHEGIAWYHGRFTGFDVQLDFDPADVSKSKVTATIDPKSVETDFLKTRSDPAKGDFNALIYGRFFLAAEHPTIRFASTAITKTSPNTGKMTGNLTFRGVTRPVTLDVTLTGQGMRGRWKAGFSATGSILRSDFGLRTTAVADEIRLTIDAEFIKR
jgi:polyisoprenoid-binding protein YceI